MSDIRPPFPDMPGLPASYWQNGPDRWASLSGLFEPEEAESSDEQNPSFDLDALENATAKLHGLFLGLSSHPGSTRRLLRSLHEWINSVVTHRPREATMLPPPAMPPVQGDPAIAPGSVVLVRDEDLWHTYTSWVDVREAMREKGMEELMGEPIRKWILPPRGMCPTSATPPEDYVSRAPISTLESVLTEPPQSHE